MKKTKLLMPLAAGLTAITPVSILTACNDTNVTSVTSKSLTTGDSVAYYKFKMKNNPSDNKVIVNVINKTAKEPVVLYTDVSTAASVAEYTVQDDGTIIVPAGYYLAPSNSASSDFALTFTYKNGDKQKTETIDGLKFNYSIDYGENLKSKYSAKVTPPDSTHWPQQELENNKTFAEIYMEDIVANPNIFQDDARYSTSKNINSEDGKYKNKFIYESFETCFNDVVYEGDGLHVHMNYKAKGTDGTSVLQFKIGTTNYEFKNFDFSFSYETPNGYTISKIDGTKGTEATLQIIDPTNNYLLDGRFQGSFEYRYGTGTLTQDFESASYDGKIDNYSMFPKSSSDTTWTVGQVAALLSFGIIQFTYDFTFDTGTAPELKIYSSYAKNAA